MDKMWFIYTMEYYSTIKWGDTNTCYNMDEPWKHYNLWKKLVTKKHMLCHSIYMKGPERANAEIVDWWLQGEGSWRREE